jgi:hypothetical protein
MQNSRFADSSDRFRAIACAFIAPFLWSGFSGAVHDSDLGKHDGEVQCEYCVAFWSSDDTFVPAVAADVVAIAYGAYALERRGWAAASRSNQAFRIRGSPQADCC